MSGPVSSFLVLPDELKAEDSSPHPGFRQWASVLSATTAPQLGSPVVEAWILLETLPSAFAVSADLLSSMTLIE